MLRKNKNEQIMFKSKNLEKSHKYKIEQKAQAGKKPMFCMILLK